MNNFTQIGILSILLLPTIGHAAENEAEADEQQPAKKTINIFKRIQQQAISGRQQLFPCDIIAAHAQQRHAQYEIPPLLRASDMTDDPFSVQFLSDENTLACVCKKRSQSSHYLFNFDYAVTLQDINQKRQLTFRILDTPAFTLSSAGICAAIASNRDSSLLKVWDSKGHIAIPMAIIPCLDDNRPSSALLSPNGKALVTGSYSNEVKVWDVNQSASSATLKGHTHSMAEPIAFSSDGERLFTKETVVSGILSRKSDPSDPTIPASANVIIRAWDVKKQARIAALASEKDFSSLAVAADGRMVAIGFYDGTIEVWDIMQHERIGTLIGHTDSIHALTLSGNILASGSSKTIRVWNVQEQRCITTLDGHHGTIKSLALALNDLVLASTSDDKTIRLWNL